MNKSFSLSNFLLKRAEFLAFVGLWLWIGIFQVQEKDAESWKPFLMVLLVLLPIQIPGFIFSWYKSTLLSNFTRRQFLTYWTSCFLVCLPIITDVCILLFPNYDPSLFIGAVLANVSLELVLSANSYYLKKVQHIKWIKKIGLENAVLLSIILLSIVISAMAVSSIGNPKFDTKEQLLIGFVFTPAKLITHFWTFLSFTLQFLFMYLCGYLLFIVNSRLLVSKILKQKGLILYILSALACIAILYPIIGQLLILLPINQIFGRDIFSLNPFLLENGFGAMAIIALSLPIVLAIQWGAQNTHILSLQKEKSQTELDLMKQQLNPHFFFNTLNNLYALSLQKSEKTPESILRLSELMRYTIYKGQEEKVTISQEINYLEDYIALQQIRLKKPLSLNFKQHISNQNIQIAPLLLIILLENAFKHGIEPAEEATFLNLSLSCTDQELIFSCENSIEPDKTATKPGIGLNNLKKRLELLYPNAYSLDITSNNIIFKTTLYLKLS
ncbi:sensor histidine kinase [Pedobacter boryungensis]|uniref:Sensor histidine kinase n=1 Tax=Pedobacter boryungensis TaxID=869962 RepID=A0ABX2D8P0_9SPHI|nr:sensor histidine kinase [Pedobacter boryungensis]NQX30433.1 sensor histidine kinase [Pedobacter boryungensis]